MSTKLLFAFTLGLSFTASLAFADEPVEQYALLVGCTQYPFVDRLPELYGPANDIPLWHRLLTSPRPAGFAFPEANVQQLLGWPDDASQRPSRENIVSAFAALIGKAKPGAQFMIVLSGHGTQQPILADQDPFDSKNPEPDGLDEVFLPADSKEGSPAIENGILDNELGGWLDQMRSKGASVWIVFDCCHSGTMTRSLDDVERSRHVEPTALGIPRERLDEAARRADAAVRQRRAAGLPVDAGEISARQASGSLVAFYAAQPFEKAPELPLPEGRPHVPENYFGLLSYTLAQTLLERRSPLSYRELSSLLAASYRARRGTRFPTPFAEGDLDREVLGARQWPLSAELRITRNGNELALNAGELQGLTVDSTLAVRPPINDPREAKTILGYVKVVSVTPLAATVEPCAFQQLAAISDVPDQSRCEIASRSFGEMRVKLFAGPEPTLQMALKRVDKEVSEMLAFAPQEADSQWRLLPVTPDLARELSLDDAAHDRVVLLAGQGGPGTSAAGSAQRRYFAVYSADDERALAGDLERDLPKLFRWQNLWRVSRGVNVLEGGETHGVHFDAFRLKNQQDPTGEPFRAGVLRSGDFVKFALRNDGSQPVWATLLYLNANFGVKHFFTGQIRPGDTLKPFVFRMHADAASSGQEGMLVFVTPVVDKTRPEFEFLEQEPLCLPEVRTRDANAPPNTPFGKLLKAAAYNRGVRDMEPVVSTTPAILTQAWVLLP